MKNKLLIATPMYGGQCTQAYTKSMIKLGILLSQRDDIDFDFAFIGNESLIPRARNIIADYFVKSDFSHLMFIDADIEFNPNDVLSMLEKDLDILCGVYPAKGMNWEAIAEAAKQGVEPHNLTFYSSFVVFDPVDRNAVIENVFEPFEIKHGGTGFMLIKRNVFEKVADIVSAYWNTDSADPEALMSEFFGLQIDPDTNILLSEDYDFCRKWRSLDGKIYAAPWVRLSHVGSYVFTGPIVA